MNQNLPYPTFTSTLSRRLQACMVRIKPDFSPAGRPTFAFFAGKDSWPHSRLQDGGAAPITRTAAGSRLAPCKAVDSGLDGVEKLADHSETNHLPMVLIGTVRSL